MDRGESVCVCVFLGGGRYGISLCPVSGVFTKKNSYIKGVSFKKKRQTSFFERTKLDSE